MLQVLISTLTQMLNMRTDKAECKWNSAAREAGMFRQDQARLAVEKAMEYLWLAARMRLISNT
ncbi:MAG: hypothetical protein AAGA11_18815 [Pseudomonadota bacterium]